MAFYTYRPYRSRAGQCNKEVKDNYLKKTTLQTKRNRLTKHCVKLGVKCKKTDSYNREGKKDFRAEIVSTAFRRISFTIGGKYWLTFSMSSMQACKSIPKSIKVHSIPSRLYSSCSSTNMWWLKNCCNFSLVKLIQSCSKPLNCGLSRNNTLTKKKKIPQQETDNQMKIK